MHRLIEKALKGETLLGTWLTINSPEVAEALSLLPFDFLVIDMEHSPLDYYDAEMMLIALKGSQAAGIVRVPWNDPVAIKRVLDMGPDGILIPWVSGLEEARTLEKAVLYPPKGIRGVGPRRAVKYGLVDRKEYYEKYLENLIVIAQVETKGAIENLEDILSVETITGVLVGPSDLSASLGMFGQIESPSFKEILEEVAKKAKARKPLVAIYAPTLEYARKVKNIGFNMIALSSDIDVLLKAYNDMIKDLK